MSSRSPRSLSPHLTMDEDPVAADLLRGSAVFQILCQRLRDSDPTLYRVSLTTCYVDGVYGDSLCAALVDCLTCSAHVQEVVLTLADQSVQPGARALADWISHQSRLHKVALFSHGEAEITTETRRCTADHARLYLDAAVGVEVVDVCLNNIAMEPLAESLHNLLCKSQTLRKLRLTVTGFPAAVVSSEDCWMRIRDGLRLNSTIQSVVLLSPPLPLLDAIMQGLQEHVAIKSVVLDSIEGDATRESHDSIQQLLQANKSLTHVRLRKVATTAVTALLEGLRRSTSLVRFELEEVDFADQVGRLRLALSENRSLRELSLDNTSLGREGLYSLVEYLTTATTNTRLRRLSVASNELEDVGSARLVCSLLQQGNQPSLECLDLSGNAWGGMEGISDIAVAGLRDTTSSLEDLNLASCQLGDEGVSVLAASLARNTTVRKLNLEYNEVGFEGIRALVGLLQTNTSLQVLDLSMNSVGDNGISLLAIFFQSPLCCVTELNVIDCEIADEGLGALGSALEQNSSVMTLGIDGNMFTDSGYEAFARSLPNMAGLKHLSIHLHFQAPNMWSTFAEAVHQNQSLISLPLFEVDTSQNLVIQTARDLIHFGLIRNRFQPLLDSASVPDSFWPDVLWWPQGSPTPQWARVSSSVHESVIFHILRVRLAHLVEKSIARGKRKTQR